MQDLNDIFSNEQGPSYLVRTGVAVAGDSARMQSVGAQFRDFGLEVIQPSLEELATGAHSLQGEAVALLAMDASSSGGISGAAEVLRQIRQHHPHLPALWVGAGQEAAPEGFEFVVHDGDELSHLDGLVSGALYRQVYADWLVDVVSDSAIDTLRQSFSLEASLVDVRLRANQWSLSGVTALVQFQGAGAAGRMMVNGSEELLSVLVERSLGAESRGISAAMELCGELANQVLGRIKGALARRRIDLSLGIPLVLKGEDVVLRQVERQPSLLLHLASDLGPIFVEVGLARLAAATVGPPAVEEDLGMATGEIEFFGLD
ncbi:MAG: chemotaxis protein CheX [Deltaproteobacteria bacterium]|jgi:CheY-specific phosphatase CheX|nr:chemotaxis protein CheX [Deltaproteobacteria bacterium]